MNLYFIHHDGHNQDWFAVADTKEQAITLWQERVDLDQDPTYVWLVPTKLTRKDCPRLLEWRKDLVLA